MTLWRLEIAGRAAGTPVYPVYPHAVSAGWRRRLSGLKRHKAILAFLALVTLFPMVLAPTHPVAVYAYLPHRLLAVRGGMDMAHYDSELTAFLISKAQIARYRNEILEDLRDSRSGRMFAVVRLPDGSLRHEQIRTWNAFLPSTLPRALEKWSDCKEITFLGDEVALWQEGKHIIAMGHYHPFGGGPTAGDALAQRSSSLVEVVVSNGLVPVLYSDSTLIPYGAVERVHPNVIRSMRAIDRSLMMELSGRGRMETAPSAHLKSFLAYLRDYRGVDIDDLESVGDEVALLCLEFREDFMRAFPEGFTPLRYEHDLDRVSVLLNLRNVHFWSLTVGRGRLEQWRSFQDERAGLGWVPPGMRWLFVPTNPPELPGCDGATMSGPSIKGLGPRIDRPISEGFTG